MDDNQPQPNSVEYDLKQAVRNAHEVLATASTIFTFSRNTLTLNRMKLIAERRSGVRNADVMSVRVEDVLNVNGAVGPLFGSLKIATKFTSPAKPYMIGPFRRKDTINLKRIIQGYVIALQDNIDVNAIPTDDLKKLLYSLGEDDRTIH